MFNACHCKSFSAYFEYFEEPYLSRDVMGHKEVCEGININYNKQNIL